MEYLELGAIDLGKGMTSRGSEWRRWEPHIHAPGTVLNSQFGAGDAWDTYLTTLENLSPRVEVIGITDYYVTDTYEELLRRRSLGRLPGVKLVFANIELRLDVAAHSGFVNLHLLVSPEESDHLEQARRFLSRLQFEAHGDCFECTSAGLIRLGKKADASINDDRAALAHGATQFKVNFSKLKEAYSKSDWAKANILIAVAGASGDGTSGLNQAADATLRQEIEKLAHIIFSSHQAQREFWLGQRAASVEHLRERYEGCKPCLHGSDAHTQVAVGQPYGDRFSWIKGAPTFDALWQACIDPAGRAFVGAAPPKTALPSQVISQVDIEGAPWASTSRILLNPGLVAVIGARGSGKTALADMIAAGCDAVSPVAWSADESVSASFLVRARPLVEDSTVKLTWGGGTDVSRYLDGRDASDSTSYPRARYLSQQFVEELCSAKGASEGLLREIERVVFEAHTDKEDAYSFSELRDHRTLRFQQARLREAESIAVISESIANEHEKEALIQSLANQVTQKQDLIDGYNKDLLKLVVKGNEVQAKRHADINLAAQALNTRVANFGAQRRAFTAMQDEVKNTRASKSPAMLREAQARHEGSGLSPEQWDAFLLIYKGDVDKALADYIVWADGEMAKINGIAPPEGDPNVALVADDADLATVPLAVLLAEASRLEKFINADLVMRNQYARLSTRIRQESGILNALKTRLTDAQGAADRRKVLQAERVDAYGCLFEAIANEQQALTDLYAPLMKRLQASNGTLQKLSFSVARVVDVARWANVAETNLIDCRKSGDFYGRGSLTKLAKAEMEQVWKNGSAAEVSAAMAAFVSQYSKGLVAHAPFAPADRTEFRAWLTQFAHWLYSTDHLSVHYEIAYDGVEIHKLSPGTRGIVLLLLYLALDDADDRPLIIDQPEENLDPKSVFDELVSLFIAAKSKRQVIMVTHNANLVINTDADQIILATAEPDPDGGLPSITYISGGLEDASMRKNVCDILEGGAEAFRERARRLRVRLER